MIGEVILPDDERLGDELSSHNSRLFEEEDDKEAPEPPASGHRTLLFDAEEEGWT
jgi:hypothetical protein